MVASTLEILSDLPENILLSLSKTEQTLQEAVAEEVPKDCWNVLFATGIE